ncbi:MAG: glycosyltransferase [Bacteroidetes bacterium]|nr:glycosyltransferase [Bacteroidota bacterium]
MKKVLVISYFWPPSGKASLHWPLYIIKHLPRHGWQPSVLTVDEDSFSHTDESLLAEIDPSLRVVKTAANEPFSLYRSFLGKKSDAPLIASETISLKNTDWRHRLAIWIRMNLFVPDARIGWMLSAVGGGSRMIMEDRPDVIISIGPPHSSHLIGKRLSRKFGIPHIPVLIDPWVDIVYYKEFKRNPLTLALDNRFERTTLRHAAHTVFVTNSARNEYLKKYPWLEQRSSVLYWGYNEENFTGPVTTTTHDTEVLLHAGNIFDYQNPAGLWSAVAKEIARGRRIRLRFAGTVSPGIKRAIADAGLTGHTDFIGFLPYQQAVQEMRNATYLLVCATEKRHVPGKLFEYLRTGNRIIAFGDDNEEVAEILKGADAGLLFPYHYDSDDILQRVQKVTPDPDAARRYSRGSIAGQLSLLLDRLR